MTEGQEVYLLGGVIIGMVYAIVVTLVVGHLRATRWDRALKRTIRQQQRFSEAVQRLTDAAGSR